MLLLSVPVVHRGGRIYSQRPADLTPSLSVSQNKYGILPRVRHLRDDKLPAVWFSGSYIAYRSTPVPGSQTISGDPPLKNGGYLPVCHGYSADNTSDSGCAALLPYAPFHLHELSFKVVHIRDDTVALVRTKNDVLMASNVHFVVHYNAKLTLAAKHAISLDRDEV